MCRNEAVYICPIKMRRWNQRHLDVNHALTLCCLLNYTIRGTGQTFWRGCWQRCFGHVERRNGGFEGCPKPVWWWESWNWFPGIRTMWSTWIWSHLSDKKEILKHRVRRPFCFLSKNRRSMLRSPPHPCLKTQWRSEQLTPSMVMRRSGTSDVLPWLLYNHRLLN